MEIFEDLDILAERGIKEQREKIKVLFSKFEKKLHERTNKQDPNVFILGFGRFIAEYVLILKTVSIEANGDNILLDCRRLCEVLIVSKYINKHDKFLEVITDYCPNDHYDFLENLKKMTEANKKMFPEAKDFFYTPQFIEEKQAGIKRQYGGEPKKPPQMAQMAKDVGYEEEYGSLYKITSKLLHFCPFSFNGDMLVETNDEKFNYFKRIEMYLVDIKKELDLIYEKAKLKNL